MPTAILLNYRFNNFLQSLGMTNKIHKVKIFLVKCCASKILQHVTSGFATLTFAANREELLCNTA